MARSLRPARVYQTAKTSLAIRNNDKQHMVPPVWLKVIESIPPSEILTRPYPEQHQTPNPKQRRPKNLFKPQQITYPEDELRRTFFKDHPWELARPRVIVEMDGMDGRRLDWSKGLRQPGVPLSGECVVQRQLWMMHNVPNITKEQAYDEARREFYLLRQQEEIERRVAVEEARMVGAYFGKSRLQVGMDLEDDQFEKWKKWASNETMKIESQRSQMYTSFGEEGPAESETSDPTIEGASKNL